MIILHLIDKLIRSMKEKLLEYFFTILFIYIRPHFLGFILLYKDKWRFKAWIEWVREYIEVVFIPTIL